MFYEPEAKQRIDIAQNICRSPIVKSGSTYPGPAEPPPEWIFWAGVRRGFPSGRTSVEKHWHRLEDRQG